MQMAVRGLCYIVTGGSMISQTGPNWKTLGQGFVFDVIPISVIVMLIAAVILWVLLDQTVVGRKFYALGGSREAARACGINLKKYVILAYALSGLFIGLAGVLYTSRANCGVAAVVLGIISNILNLLGVDSYVQQIINGAIIVLAVGLDTFTRSLRVSQ